MIDVSVRGAGPAGSYCANLLARSGVSVHLTDVADFPRDKLCGGGLTKKSLDLIEALEPSFRSSGIPEFIHDFHLVQPATLEWCSAHVTEDWIALVHRKGFDDWLRQKAIAAGATFSKETVPSRFVVAADGAASKLGQSIRGVFGNHEVAIATECTAPNPAGPFVSIILNPTTNPGDLGYGWSFARTDSVGVGTAVLRSHDANLAGYRSSVARAASRLYGCEISGFTNWIIPLYRPRPAARGNVALIGDALGTADPLFLEGIASGLFSAKTLAECFLASGDFSGYTSAVTAHPYFRQMDSVRRLQRQGNSDFESTYDLFSGRGELRGLIEMICGFESPGLYTTGLMARHPVRYLRAWLASVLA